MLDFQTHACRRLQQFSTLLLFVSQSPFASRYCRWFDCKTSCVHASRNRIRTEGLVCASCVCVASEAFVTVAVAMSLLALLHLKPKILEKDEEVCGILKRAGIEPEDCIFGVPTFPGLAAIVQALMLSGLDDDATLTTLFGDPSRVSSLKAEAEMLRAAPPGSPAAFHLAALGTRRAVPCGHCSRLDSAAHKHMKCPCNRAYYCSKQCQRSDWKVHRPTCKRARGIEPSQSEIDVMESILQERERLRALYEKQEEQKWDEMCADITHALNAADVRLRRHLPPSFDLCTFPGLAEAGLRFEDLHNVLLMGPPTDGTYVGDDASGRAVEYIITRRGPGSGASVYIPFDRLLDRSDRVVGIHVYAAFVRRNESEKYKCAWRWNEEAASANNEPFAFSNVLRAAVEAAERFFGGSGHGGGGSGGGGGGDGA